MPKISCSRGVLQAPLPPPLADALDGGGMKGTQLETLIKNTPKKIKNRTTASLIVVTTRLKRELSRMPVTSTAVRSKAINVASRLILRQNGPVTPPVMTLGKFMPILCKISLKYFDQPIETAEAPTRNSRIRSQPMIQAMNSPSEAYENV